MEQKSWWEIYAEAYPSIRKFPAGLIKTSFDAAQKGSEYQIGILKQSGLWDNLQELLKTNRPSSAQEK